MLQRSIDIIARKIADDHDLPDALVLGVIEVESAGNTWAARFERHYRWCMNVRTMRVFTASPSQARSSEAPNGFPGTVDPYYSSADTEWIGQKTSWGLMQVMGAVAREHGYTDALPALCEPMHGIEYGCRHLARLRDRFIARHGWAGVLDAYNDGNARIESADDYPHKVARVSDEAAAILGIT